MLKPQRTQFVPLFEEHLLINKRFAELPENIREGLAAIIGLDENAVICGSLGMYLTGCSDEVPNGIDVIVQDASKLRLAECGEEGPFAEITAVRGPQEETQQQEEEEKEKQAGSVVIITITPEGEITDMGEPRDDAPEGYYDNDGNFNFEGFKWVAGRPEGVACSAKVFETCNKIKTMPIALGGITVLVEDPGVMSEYRNKFAKIKGMKQGKPKFDKPYNYNGKQPHVKSGSGMADAPAK